LRINPKLLPWEGALETSRGWRLALAALALLVGLLGGSAIRPVWTIDPDA
jgi:hypothetical protein